MSKVLFPFWAVYMLFRVAASLSLAVIKTAFRG
jgi:hypothetical protein